MLNLRWSLKSPERRGREKSEKSRDIRDFAYDRLSFQDVFVVCLWVFKSISTHFHVPVNSQIGYKRNLTACYD